MSQKILLTGAGGQLGRALIPRLSPKWDVMACNRGDLDITDEKKVRSLTQSLRPVWIINCAAWTLVDQAEDDPEGAYRVNDQALGVLADAAMEVGARIVHFSTDYVFDGVFDGESPKPYTEEDRTRPLNVYGASKLAGEKRLLEHEVAATILRTSWLYSEFGKNFFNTMLCLAKERSDRDEPLRIVHDQVGTPTDVHSLSELVERVLEGGLDGLFHASCQGGEASWIDFSRAIFKLAGLEIPLVPVKSDEFPRTARRPEYSVLANARLQKMGEDCLPAWEKGLQGVHKRYIQLS